MSDNFKQSMNEKFHKEKTKREENKRKQMREESEKKQKRKIKAVDNIEKYQYFKNQMVRECTFVIELCSRKKYFFV
jgi:hypothetical protein